jgi:peptide-methionine (S)-S-oxide reductase
MEKATFAAGCFWHVEAVFIKTKGVKSTEVGYIGGHTDNPTYEDVCTDKTGHAEAIQVEYDPDEISYSELVNVFFKNHNPTTPNRQGPDIGIQYRSAIFCHNVEQERDAKEVKEKLNPFAQKTFGNDIVTEIKSTSKFYRAEEYHQKYFEKNF